MRTRKLVLPVPSHCCLMPRKSADFSQVPTMVAQVLFAK